MLRPKSSFLSVISIVHIFVAICPASGFAREPIGGLGFSQTRLARIDQLLAEKVERGDLAGAVVLVARHGEIAHFSAVGFADLGTGRTMERNDIFRLYSMTKPVAAVALMMLYEEGRFQLDDPIAMHLPEFADVRVLRTPDAAITDTVAPTRAPTIHDLLRHTAGFTHGFYETTIDHAYDAAHLFDLDVTLEEEVRRLSAIPLRYQPGAKWEYSIAPDVEARLVEVLSGMPFDDFLQTRIFGPLGMRDTGFSVPAGSVGRLAPVHWERNGQLTPCNEARGCFESSNSVIDAEEIASYTSVHAHRPGSYGLVGTAEDYWRFSQMLLNGGEFERRRLLAPATVQFMTRNHLNGVTLEQLDGHSFGLGFGIVEDPARTGMMQSPGSYSWGGAAGTVFWIDPRQDLIVVIMTQHMAAPRASWIAVMGQVSAIVYGALMDGEFAARDRR